MIELERLLSLALGELSGDELDRVELHVLSCSSCAGKLERLVQLGSATRELLMSGKVQSFLLPAQSARLDALGLISRRYRVAPAGAVACGVAHDDVYLLTELEADLAGVARVDFRFCVEGAPEVRVSDVPFDAGSGLVGFISRGEDVRRLPTTRIDLELLAVDGDRERSLGTYVLNHAAGGS